jgi:hypothetical protein
MEAVPEYTPYQSQLFAGELARRAARDSVESIGSTLVDAQVDRKLDKSAPWVSWRAPW